MGWVWQKGLVCQNVANHRSNVRIFVERGVDHILWTAVVRTGFLLKDETLIWNKKKRVYIIYIPIVPEASLPP